MKVLVIGSGGREHALVWRLSREGSAELLCTPGNPGIAQLATCFPHSPRELGALAEEARRRGVDLTIVGPEAPLVEGVVDVFAARGLRILGPTRAASRLEASKAFMKDLCRRYGIPTSPFRIFDSPAEAVSYARRAGRPLVVKVDGLAGGKGVTVAPSAEDAVAAIEAAMVERRFGEAGSRVVVEEVLEGEEVSVFALCDGTSLVPLLAVQDHKRLLEGDRGPNTGGMGACAPVPSVGPAVMDRIRDEILEPVLWAMAQEGSPFRGVLFAGLMLTGEGPQVLEFNVRLGDPEAQALLPLWEGSLLEAAEAVLGGRVHAYAPRWRPGAAVCVVLCAEGYPGAPRTGHPITGLEEAESLEGVLVFHAGTARRDGRLVTAGGRVINVVGVGSTLAEARDRAYRGASLIDFDGRVYRRDIGARALVSA
jgi:phosphoribosylamine--glycine ligase